MVKNMLVNNRGKITEEQLNLISKINRLVGLYRKGKLGKTGHNNIKKYRKELDELGYDWNRDDIEISHYTMYVLAGNRRKWVKN